MRIALALLAACGSSPNAQDTPDAPVLPDAQGDAQSDAPAADTQRIFAHSGDVLYALDRETLDATEIGPITGIGAQALLDLAIDKDDHFIGITRDTLYRIEPATGAATRIQDLPQAVRGFTSLTYAPQDVGPDILVGVNDRGQVFRIDVTASATATATVIGNFGTTPDGDPIGSSGDLIAIRGFGIFATVNLNVGMENYEDHLAQIDPVTWDATVLGQAGTGFDKIFGLGFWNGTLYGFVDDGVDASTGSLIELDPRTGGGQLISKSPIRWFGAAVTTDAPI